MHTTGLPSCLAYAGESVRWSFVRMRSFNRFDSGLEVGPAADVIHDVELAIASLRGVADVAGDGVANI